MMGVEAAYHRAPYPARVAAASVRGLVLRSRRYGPRTEELVDAALARERWDPERWASWQDDRLAAVLAIARDHVAAYAGQVPPGRGGRDALGTLPLLDKQQLRADPGAFVRRDAPRRTIVESTSGTTGTPLRLVISREDYRRWYALAEARWRRWYGVSRQDRWAIVGGQPVVAPTAASPPYWVWNAGLRQLYLSSYHVADRTAHAYVRAIDEHRVAYLLGYPSAIHALAVACRAGGLRPRPLRVVVANAEPVLDHQREVISEVFGCPVRETYGMAEYVAAASECEHGRLHLWPEAGMVEVLARDHDGPLPAGQVGRLACTGLVNTTMPLLRYLVGDAGSLAPAGPSCACGRTLPVLQSVEGRVDDLVRTVDGRIVGRLDPVFKGSMPIAGAQIVQEELDRFRVLVVPAPGYGPRAAQVIVDRLRHRVGDVRVDIEEVDALPTGPNGKFKAVVSRVLPEG
jgi:phenylacetate-CoA ligase